MEKLCRERHLTDGNKAAHIGGCIVFVQKLKRVSVRFARERSLIWGIVRIP